MSPSPAVQELIVHTAWVLLVVGVLLGMFAVMTWVERRTLAFMQFRLGPNRAGPAGILQPIADGIKLFFKEEALPAAANKWAFVAAPGLAVATALLAVGVLPVGPGDRRVDGLAGRRDGHIRRGRVAIARETSVVIILVGRGDRHGIGVSGGI